MNKEQWEIEFDKEFPNKLGEVVDDFGSTVKSDIENFIKEKLEQQDVEWFRIVSKNEKENIEKLEQQKKEYEERIEKAIKDVSLTNEDLTRYGDGFEQAIEDIKNKWNNN